MTHFIAICNQKGGVGKTTTAINLAGFFAQDGKRVLVLDLDAQGHVAPGFGLQKGNGLYRLMVGEEPLINVAIPARERLWVVTNDHTCELVKEHVKQANFREYLLSNLLEEAADHFDLILLDTPPSTDVLHILALVAANFAIIPANLDYLALDGVNYVLKTLRSLGRYPGVTAPALIGVLPTLYDRVTRETIANATLLQQAVGAERVLPPIPRDTKVREASSHGQTLWEYAPACPAAVGFPNGSRQKNSRNLVGGYLHLAEIAAGLLNTVK